MKVSLVTMPWQALEMPSLQLALLSQAARLCDQPPDISFYYGNVRWAEYLLQASGGQLTPADYNYITDVGLLHGMGEWIFASALNTNEQVDRASDSVEPYHEYLRRNQADPGPTFNMRDYAIDFVDVAAQEILAMNPDIVGFTTTFAQNVPSLAVAKCIKSIAPHVAIVFGGGNCDGVMGAALHRAFPFVDYVVRGEGEATFVKLIDALCAGKNLTDIPSLCWRSKGETVVNRNINKMTPLADVSIPHFDEWFECFDQSSLVDYLEPRLIIETARGCWWGEKHQCTFCGLNGSAMTFRSKEPDQAWREIEQLVRRHQVLDIVTVDNIIDSRYITTLLPKLENSTWDLRVHYEVKSNLKRHQLEQFRRAGVVHLQPGIESLSTTVLTLMKKGVHACQNVQVLRDADELGISISWNYLYGFPGEQESDYLAAIAQLPALVHLPPPLGASRILLERFSPFFEQPELGFQYRRPADYYSFIYEISELDLYDLVYHFSTVQRGIGGDVEMLLQKLVEQWKKSYYDSTLEYRLNDHIVEIRDRRLGWENADYLIEDRGFSAAYQLLSSPRGAQGLLGMCAEMGYRFTENELADWLKSMIQLGFVFEDAGRYVALAVGRSPIRMREAIV